MTINQSSASVMAHASSQGVSHAPTILHAVPGEALHVPGGNFLLTADFHRAGPDLVLSGKDGHEVVVRDYFASHNPPDLISGTGGIIHPDLAEKLAGAIAPGQWAQEGAPAPQLHAIGEIQKMSGVVKVHHVDGHDEILKQGATVFQGDVLETAGDGSVGIVFADRSTFSLGKNGRMVMDELVYDPQAHTGHSTMSVVQGTFSFVSGQIAKSGPDNMAVKTPVMTIGIRGTTVGGFAAAEGAQNTVALLNDDDGGVGQIVVATQNGQPMVLTQANMALQLSSAFQAPPAPVVLPPQALQQLIPELSAVQASRPSQPTSDPHINTNPSGSSNPANGQQQGTSNEKTGSASETGGTASGAATNGKGESNTVSSSSPDSLLVAIPTISAPVTPVVVPVVAPVVPVVPVVAPVTTAPATTAQPTTVAPVVHDNNTATQQNSTVASSIIGSGGNYTLVGGNDESIHIETQQGTSPLTSANWTMLANGYNSTLELYEFGSSQSLTGTVMLYANTFASPESSAPTLSLHNDSHGVTIYLEDTVKGTETDNLAVVNSNGYVKSAIATGFHHIVGSTGNDKFTYYAGNSLTIDGGGGDDTLVLNNAATVNDAGFNTSNTAILTALNIDSMIGSSGNDTFLLGGNTHVIDGGAGVNTVDYSHQTSGITVLMNGAGAGTASGGGFGTDLLTNIEVVVGGSGGDTLVGDSNGDSIYGGAGNDTIVGGSGTNVLDGGSGGGDVLQYTDTASPEFIYLNGTAAGTAIHAGVTDTITNIEVVVAGDGSNHIYGDNRGDTIISGAGDDFIAGGAGNDTLNGGGGINYLDYHNFTGNLTAILGGAGAGTEYGTGVGTDILYNFRGIEGGSGNDYLSGGNSTSSVSITGGAGNDTIAGGSGNDLLMGDAGTDTVDYSSVTSALTVQLGGTSAGHGWSAQSGTDTLFNFEIVQGGQGGDTLIADTLGDSLYGNSGNDTLVSISGNDLLDGGAGNDLIYGGSGTNILLGGSGNDILVAGSGTSTLDGGVGNDTLIAGSGHSTLYGGSGNDTLLGGSYNDTLDGGAGTDVFALHYPTAKLSVLMDGTVGTAITGVGGTDILYNIEVVSGGSASDKVQLLARNTELLTSNVTFDGGGGTDTLFVDTSGSLTVSLSGTSGSVVSAAGGTATLVNVEVVGGGIGADTLISSSGTHVLSGSWFSQADATAMNAVAAATGTLLTDSSGTSSLTASSFEAVSADGHWLAYQSGSLFYRESAAGGAQTASLITPSSSAPSNVLLSNNGRDVVYSDSTAVFYYNTDISHGSKISNSANSSFDLSGGAVAISGDGHYVAYSDLYQNNAGSYGLEVVSVRTGRAVTEILLGSTEATKAVYTNNGGELFYNVGSTLDVAYLSNEGGSVYTKQLATGVQGFSASGDGSAYAYSDGSFLYVTNSRFGQSNTKIATFSDMQGYNSAISGNGRFVAYWEAGTNSTAILYDCLTQTSTVLGTMGGNLSANTINLSADGHYIYLSSSTGVLDVVNPYFSASSNDLNTLIGGAGHDTLLGGLAIPSSTVVTVSTATLGVTVNAGNTLIAGTGTEVLAGGGGSNDFVLQAGSTGTVSILGGGLAENQFLDLSAVTANLFLDLRNTIMAPTSGELLLQSGTATLATDYVSGVNNAIGGTGNNTLVGNQNANTLVAGSGASTTFVGHGGADAIFFGAHTNVLQFTEDYHAETVYLDNVSTSANILTADGNVGIEGAAHSGNDLILYFSDEGGGGKTVFKNYFSSSNVTLQIADDGAANISGTVIKSDATASVTEILGGTTSVVTMDVMTGTTGDDLLVGASDHMLFLTSTSALTGDSSGKGDDVFIYGSNNIVVGNSSAYNGATVYYSETTAALAGHGITANLSATYGLTVKEAGQTSAMTGFDVVYGFGSTDYLYGVDEVVGTSNGDTFIGGNYSTTSANQSNDVAYRAGAGNNEIIDAGRVNQVVSSNTIALVSGVSSAWQTTAVMADYSASTSGITANLNSVNSATTMVIGVGTSAATSETVMLTGTVYHDSTHTDQLFGVTEIRGSAFSDTITLSSLGSYVQSSRGNDTYHLTTGSTGNYNTIDYSDATGGLFVNFSSTALSYAWTFEDGTTHTLTLAAAAVTGAGVQTAYLMHDWAGGSGYTDVLDESAGKVNDIRMSSEGGIFEGTGWHASGTNALTMDLQSFEGSGSTGALIYMPSSSSSWGKALADGNTVLFSDVAAIKGSDNNDTFYISANYNPQTLIGGGGSDTVDVGSAGWHTWANGTLISTGTDTLLLNGSSVAMSDFSAVAGEVTVSSGMLNIGTLVASVVTANLDAGTLVYQNGSTYSLKGTSSSLFSGSFIGATAGDVILAYETDVANMHLDGNSTSALLDLRDSGFSSLVNFEGMSISNIETLQLDGTPTAGLVLQSDMANLIMHVDALTSETGVLTATHSGATTLALAVQNTGVLSLGDSQYIVNGSTLKLNGFTDIVLSGQSLKHSSGSSYIDPDSVLATVDTALLNSGVQTLDMSHIAAPSSVSLSGITHTSGNHVFTLVGGSGIDQISVQLEGGGTAGTYVLQGSSADVVDFGNTYGSQNYEVHATVDASGYAVLYNGSQANDDYNNSVVLQGIDLVRFNDREVLVMGTAVHTAALDINVGETMAYINASTAGVGVLSGLFSSTLTESGFEAVTFGGYTAYLSVGYDPGYDSGLAATGNGDQYLGTATLSADTTMNFGGHLNLDIYGMASHDLLDLGGNTLTADGADLKLLIEPGSTVSSGATAELITNMASDNGNFGHITGLDGYAHSGYALELDFYSDSAVLSAHSASYSLNDSTVIGSTGADYIVGGNGNQTLSGGGGADEILAVSGNDTVVVGDNSFTYLDGGSGSSKLNFNFTQASTIDLTGSGVVSASATAGLHRSDSVEHFDQLNLTNSSGSTLVLNEAAVYSASNASNSVLTGAGVSAASASHALIIGGTGGDVLDLTHTSSSWTAGSTVNLTVDGTSHSYQVYTNTFHGTSESVYVDSHVKVVTS